MDVEPKLKYVIFRTNEKKTKSKIVPLYLKNLARYGNFQRSKSCNLKTFKSQYLSEFWRYGPDFNFYRFQKKLFATLGLTAIQHSFSGGWQNDHAHPHLDQSLKCR